MQADVWIGSEYCMEIQLPLVPRHRPATRHLCQGDVGVSICTSLDAPELTLEFVKQTLVNFWYQPEAAQVRSSQLRSGSCYSLHVGWMASFIGSGHTPHATSRLGALVTRNLCRCGSFL